MKRQAAKPALFTKEQREAIAKELSVPYGMVQLVADGHQLLARVERMKGLRWTVVVYVDGKIEPADFKLNSALGAKFWRTETKCALSTKALAEQQRHWGKRHAQKLKKKYMVTLHLPWFPSAGSWLAKLQRAVASIEGLAIGYSACKAAKEARDATAPA